MLIIRPVWRGREYSRVSRGKPWVGRGRYVLAGAANRGRVLLLALLVAVPVLGGCSDQIRPVAPGQLAEFNRVDPGGPAVDMDRLARARMPMGSYRVVPGDVLELQMPRIVDQQMPTDAAVLGGNQSYKCRISDEGTIVLPIIGSFPVAGRSLSEIDLSVMAQYYPKYIKKPLPIHVTVSEYSTRKVSIVGAVTRPGVYALRHDQMSLIALLMEAGGIVQNGASVIRIVRSAGDSPGLSFLRRTPQVGRPEAPPAATTTVWEEDRSEELMAGSGRGRVRAVFQRDPPGRTIGWLSLVEGNRVLLQSHLDVSRETERFGFLTAATERIDSALARSLYARLNSLSIDLEADPRAFGAGQRGTGGSWWTVNGWYFETPLAASGSEDRRPAQNVAWRNASEARAENVTTSVLPIKGLNIPFADVALEEGDSVVVERPVEQFVSVIGLVNRPANMPYPPDARYNLIQAIAFAGGLDLAADPRYVSVYRLSPDGTVSAVTVQLVNPENEQDLTEILALPVRPGDVVSVEHTPRTRTNVFLDRVFRISLGLYFNPESLWEDD